MKSSTVYLIASNSLFTPREETPKRICKSDPSPSIKKPNTRGLAIFSENDVYLILPGGSMATLSDLSPRETEILKLVLAGRTNKAIAAQICITEKTVEFHLAHIYAKIGVQTRLMAGIWAIKEGLEKKTGGIPS